MGRKIFLFVAIVCGLSMGAARADSDEPHQTLVERPLQFYAGLVGGIDRMMGRRTEGLSEPALLTVFAGNKRMQENNSTISAVGGFWWKLPPLPVLLGPEVYFGRGNALSNVSANSLDAAGNSRLYSTDFQRKFFYGGLIRIGYLFCPDFLGSFSLGIDRSQFLTKRILTNSPAAPIAVLPTIITRTRGLNGFIFGMGLEKHFGHLGVGLDLKFIQYRRQLTMDKVNAPVGQSGIINLSVRPIIYSAAIRLCYLF